MINKKTKITSSIHISICCMPHTPPFGTQPSPKKSLWGLQHSQSGLLKCITWQFNHTKMQGCSLDLNSWGVSKREETHSTLINTWPHYLSHVAELHWGKFNTDLLRKVFNLDFHLYMHLIMCMKCLSWCLKPLIKYDFYVCICCYCGYVTCVFLHLFLCVLTITICVCIWV